MFTSFILYRIYEQKREKDGEVHESFEAVIGTVKGYFTPTQVTPQQQQHPAQHAQQTQIHNSRTIHIQEFNNH